MARGNPSNLKPIKPGQVLNPEGKNQWTGTRKEFERYIARVAAEPSDGDPTITKAEALARKAWELALKGDKVAFREVLKRVWPEVQKHEVSRADHAPPAFTPLENLDAADRATMLRLAQKAIRGGDGKPLVGETLEEQKQNQTMLVREED